MATQPREALNRLIEAFEAHFEAALAHEDSEALAVIEATDRLIRAFDEYDDSLYTHTEVDTPFDVYLDEGDDSDDDDDLESLH